MGGELKMTALAFILHQFRRVLFLHLGGICLQVTDSWDTQSTSANLPQSILPLSYVMMSELYKAVLTGAGTLHPGI